MDLTPDLFRVVPGAVSDGAYYAQAGVGKEMKDAAEGLPFDVYFVGVFGEEVDYLTLGKAVVGSGMLFQDEVDEQRGEGAPGVLFSGSVELVYLLVGQVLKVDFFEVLHVLPPFSA